MAIWLKRILVLIGGFAIFIGVAIFVNDLHPLVDFSLPYSCENLYGMDASNCEIRTRQMMQEQYTQETWLAMACGGLAALLFWFFSYRFFLRR
jgi:hypothetical protein